MDKVPKQMTLFNHFLQNQSTFFIWNSFQEAFLNYPIDIDVCRFSTYSEMCRNLVSVWCLTKLKNILFNEIVYLLFSVTQFQRLPRERRRSLSMDRCTSSVRSGISGYALRCGFGSGTEPSGFTSKSQLSPYHLQRAFSQNALYVLLLSRCT